MVVEKAVADGLGMGIDVKTSQGVIIVNVGFDTTEISILSLGGVLEKTELDKNDNTMTNYYWIDVDKSVEVYKNVYGNLILSNQYKSK